MPVSAGKEKTPVRGHVSMACEFCRKNKTKVLSLQICVRLQICIAHTLTRSAMVSGLCAASAKSEAGDASFRCASTSANRISLRRSIEHFSSRVVQLERFIVANGLSVPPPLGADRAVAIDELMATFSSRAGDAGHSSPTDSTETAPGRGPQEEPAALSIDDQEDGVPGPGTGWLAPQAQMSDMFGSGMGPTLPGLEFDDMALSSEMAQAPGFFDDFSFAFDTDMTGTAALMDMPFVMGPHPTESSHGDLPVSAGLNAGSDSDIVQDMDGHSDVTDEISDRMGRLLAAKGGGWRYYGATSNLHLAQTRHIVDLAAKKSITDVLLAARLETLGLAHALPDDLICHLTRLYFTWHNPSLQIVDQRAFEQAQKAQPKDQTFYSEVLMNAMSVIVSESRRTRSASLIMLQMCPWGGPR
ncbi:hypothetical protein LTR17_025372 [Elasticomyces elasticus]|nr:hypothetical protein LTR17_025372 [Elasticomyces elasticus]